MTNVVFLPGIIAPAAMRYEPLLAHLDDVASLTKDLAVYNTDAPPADYSIAMEVADIERAADDAGFGRFHLYGHSAGGAVALAYIAEHPERVLSLAVDEPAHDFTEEMRSDLDAFRPVASLPIPERMRTFMQLQVSSAVELPKPPDGAPPSWMAKRPAGIDAFLVALERHDRLEDRYRNYAGPVLYTWGNLTHPRWDEVRTRLSALFHDFTAERFEGLHHLNTSHQAEPERVTRLLRALWQRAEAASA